MKAIHVFTCAGVEFQTTAKDRRQATRYLEEEIKANYPATRVKDWQYQGSYDA